MGKFRGPDEIPMKIHNRKELKPSAEMTDKELLADAIRLYEKQTGKKYDDNSRNPRR
jgi:hypothetical protein